MRLPSAGEVRRARKAARDNIVVERQTPCNYETVNKACNTWKKGGAVVFNGDVDAKNGTLRSSDEIIDG